jgi:tetratricopeptide (TPR) repeat protein
VDFSKHIQKADEAMRRRNYDFAAELYRQLVDLSPDLGEARAGLRRALLQKFKAKKGGRFLRGLSGALPISRAKAAAKLGKHDACAKALEDYLATNPVDEEANLMLGNSLETQGHLKSACAVYEFCAEIAPKSPEALKRAGGMMHATGEHDKALDYYERALAADPRDQEALKARKNLAADMALSQSKSKNVSHSREMMKDADGARAIERSRRIHMSEDDLREELAAVHERFLDTPTDPELMVQLAGVHMKLKDNESALEFTERALEYRRDSFELICQAGDLGAKLLKKRIAKADKAGDAELAGQLEGELNEQTLKDHRRRVEIRPSDGILRLGLARKLLRANEVDGALAELQKCQNEPRVRSEALFLLGQCFQEKGILDLAKKEYEKALEGTSAVDERAKEILYCLGTIAEQQGSTTDARSCYIQIYEVDISYRDVATKMQTLN